jgi:hypothetical protein
MASSNMQWQTTADGKAKDKTSDTAAAESDAISSLF